MPLQEIIVTVPEGTQPGDEVEIPIPHETKQAGAREEFHSLLGR